MKRMTLFVMALAMVLGLAQCKKDQPVTPDAQGVTITLNVGDNNSGEKVNVDPNADEQVTFTNGDQILVASDGKYIGMLTRTGGIFSGEVFNPVEDQPLYFYFLGNKAYETALEAGTTTECTVNISDQTGELPVISMGQSRDANGKPLNYQDGMTSFYSRLYNKASLMKFNVTTPSEAAICITGMNNTVTVNFGQPTEDNYGFTYGKDDAGLIMMAGQEGTGEKTYWAIVLPQAELAEGTEGSVYSFDEAYVGTRPAIHAIEVNKFYHEVEDVITMEVSTVVDPLFIPLTFQARTAGVTIGINISSLEYSINGGEWTSYNGSITLDNVGDIVSFRVLYPSNQEYLQTKSFSCTGGQCYIYGNVMSLLRSTDYATNFTLPRGDTFSNLFSGNANIDIHPNKDLVLPSTELKSYCYSSMFSGCTGLTKAPVLPATTMANFCYSNMFNGCTSLTTAPALPATSLASLCYANMFEGCTGLTTAPELPAETLANQCYQNMFLNCTSLTTAPALPATSLASLCYANMFEGCTGLTTAPDLPATTLAPQCYISMFFSCTSLTTAPELPATSLAMACYSSMFNGCTSLTTAPALPAISLAMACYSGMFAGCTSLTTAPELPATSLATSCYASMFEGCTGLTTAPELPAKTLVDGCYSSMFSGCSSLNSITCLATTGIGDHTEDWVDGVASTGTFTNASGASWPTGISGIPSGWEVVTQLPEGALSGLFSIADGHQVYFSKGNLQYQASTNTWRFATNQYDYVGSDNSNISSSYSGWIDLFGWATSGYNNGQTAYQPYSTSTSNSSYYNGNITGTYDWGYNAISNGGNQENSGWRTLNKFQWTYLMEYRNNASSKYGFGEVNNVKGMILLPDEWTLPDGLTFNSGNSSTNVYTEYQWNQMESHGAVFLPAAGYRSGNYYELSTQGMYWSSTFHNGDNGRVLVFSASEYYEGYVVYNQLSLGCSVRLIRDL